MLRTAQWGGLGVNRVGLLADIGRANNIEPLGVSGHDAVLDAVVHHLDEVSATVRSAVQIALFGRTARLLASRCSRYVTDARRNGLEDGIEVLHGSVRSEEHTSELQS